MLMAFTRGVSAAINRCELTYLERSPVNWVLAQAQHATYERRLQDAGCRLKRLAAGASLPDSVFIEDTAVVFDELAVITRPGAACRRAETPAVATALRLYRSLAWIEAPGSMDGGDVLVTRRRVFVGLSIRTNCAAAAQLRSILAPFGYRVQEIEVRGCLHLKSAVTQIGENLLLMNPAWLPPGPFASFDRIAVDPQEPRGANAVLAGRRIIFPTAYPRTRERVEQLGLRVCCVDADELAKAEGALTCCSLIFETKGTETV
jgi:dimethylargininase